MRGFLTVPAYAAKHAAMTEPIKDTQCNAIRMIYGQEIESGPRLVKKDSTSLCFSGACTGLLQDFGVSLIPHHV
jgi:hypothetical protein